MLEIDPAILASLKEALADHGALTRADMQLGWGLDETGCELALMELGRLPWVRRGRKRGRDRLFVVEDHQSFAPQNEEELGDDSASGGLLKEPWQRQSVERLLELLRYNQLESLLGSLLFTLRRARRAETGEDRRGTKQELATALVLRHGVDLLADPSIRKIVASAAGDSSPGRWHPGKAAAQAFVANLGFPRELAGRPLPTQPPSLEFLDSHPGLKPLAPFQREVLTKLLLEIYDPGSRAMVSLPTGAGKTRVAVEAMATWILDRWDHELEQSDRGVVLWLAHTEELCEQAIACFQDVWRDQERVAPTMLARFWGGYTKSPEEAEELRYALLGASVLVSTPNRMTRMADEDDEFLASIRAQTGVVVIDEAHRAAAPTYRRLLSFMGKAEHPISVLGLTATPFRMEYQEDQPLAGTNELREIFHTLIEPTITLGLSPRTRLQEMGILAHAKIETLQTTTTIRMDEELVHPLQEEIERIDQFLALRTDRTPRRLEILERLLPLAENPQHLILYFGPSVQDAECMAFLLQRRGIPSAVVSGSSKRSARRQAIESFREGKVRVLCNCEVLTTGFDAPKVTHVVMGRPTVSQVLYEQMVGRGLRGQKFGGTESCTIIDCVDDIQGRRPELGYEAFRAVWGERRRQGR